jgi:hypothetical protein
MVWNYDIVVVAVSRMSAFGYSEQAGSKARQ